MQGVGAERGAQGAKAHKGLSKEQLVLLGDRTQARTNTGWTDRRPGGQRDGFCAR